MTRFLLDIDEAINLILKSTKYSNVCVVPMARSFKIKDLFEIYKEKFGLNYEITSLRTGEKIHEIMASNEEIRRMEYIKEDNLYLLHPKKEYNNVNFKSPEYSSKGYCLTKQELYNYFEERNFFNE